MGEQPTKIESELSDADFKTFCDRLLKLPGKQRTLRGIAALAGEYGITVSHEGARSFKRGPFARYIDKLERSRETTNRLVEAARGGAHPLDAIEEAAVIELQDEITSGADVDLKRVVGLLTKLRLSISMREESRRKQTDLERKLRETGKRIEVADAQLKLRDEQIAKLTADRAEREEKNARAKAALDAVAKKKGGISADTLKRIEEAAALL